MTVRVGLTGFGSAGRVHTSVLLQRDDTKLAAICDADEQVLEQVSGGVTYTDHAEMVESEDLDLSIVATPPSVRTGPVRQAAAEGVPVLVEKPTALSTDTMAELMDIGEEYGVPISAVQNLRYYPVMQAALEAVEQGLVGEVTSVDVLWSDRMDLTGSDLGQQSWVGDFYGGAITESVPHFTYLATAFTADLDELSFEWRNFSENQFQDGLSITALDERDRLVTIRCLTQARERQRVRVHGTDGSLLVDLDDATIAVEGADDAETPEVDYSDVPEEFRNRWRRGHHQLLGEYVRSIEAGSPSAPVPLEDDWDVVRAVELVESV